MSLELLSLLFDNDNLVPVKVVRGKPSKSLGTSLELGRNDAGSAVSGNDFHSVPRILSRMD